ncbi:MAG: dTDP-4-dehydrorhamnose 3,5-epimerase family protein [Planctomycetes bacterium]|nr:dTDP-4-dehydrorhamnose 3,5-epimerase family protein [Planctomycetota bacterium]
MEIHDTELHGVRRIVPKAFSDHRGSYVEIFDTEHYRAVCGDVAFVQDDISVSHPRVLRGLHGDFATWKLVSVLHGTGYALLADNRPESPTFRRWQAFELSGDNRNQLLLPPGIGNSICVLQGPLVYWYKQSTHFADGRQFTIRWDDPDWGFQWPITDPILSARDQKGAYVSAS